MTPAPASPFLAAGALLLATAAQAYQDGAANRDTGIQQVPAATGPSLPYVPLPLRDPLPPTQLSPRGSASAPDQLTRDGATAQPAPQLNREGRSARAGTQLSRGRPSARGSDPLSSTRQSAPGATVRLEGKDRCDPQAGASAGKPACDRVIETRSAEFVRPNPLVLSPEQRLLVDQRLREMPSTAENAARRLGRNDIDPGAPDSQGIASLVFAPPVAPPAKPEEQLPAGVDAEVLGIIQGLAGATPTTPPN